MKVPLLDLSEQNQKLRPEIEAALGRVLDTNAFHPGRRGQGARRTNWPLIAGRNTRSAVRRASDALLLALMAFDVGPGDEVITTPYSFFATVSSDNASRRSAGFRRHRSGDFQPGHVADRGRITERTKAIEPVHLYGQCADMADFKGSVRKPAFRSSKMLLRRSELKRRQTCRCDERDRLFQLLPVEESRRDGRRRIYDDERR